MSPEASRYHDLTAIISREGAGFVALCPELDIASQGASVEAATENLAEALELFFEASAPAEIDERFAHEIYVTRLGVSSS